MIATTLLTTHSKLSYYDDSVMTRAYHTGVPRTQFIRMSLKKEVLPRSLLVVGALLTVKIYKIRFGYSQGYSRCSIEPRGGCFR